MGSLPPKHYLTETRKSYATPGVYFGNCALDLMSQGSTLPYTITFPRLPLLWRRYAAVFHKLNNKDTFNQQNLLLL